MASAPLNYSTLIQILPIKLSSTNYMVWKSQFQVLLESENLFGYLDGSFPKPAAGSSDGITGGGSDSSKATDGVSLTPEQWSAQDKRFQALLRSSLTAKTMPETIGCDTVRDMWQALAAAFDNQSASRELHLRDELLTARRGSDSINNFHSRFKAILDQIASIGAPVSGRDKVMIFLRALGPAFSEFTAVQIAQHPLPSYADVVARARSHETFTHSQTQAAAITGGTGADPAAFFASGVNARGHHALSQMHAPFSARGLHARGAGRESHAPVAWKHFGGGSGGGSGGFSGGSSNGGSGKSGRCKRDGRRRWKCQLCQEYGHGARTCPNPNPDANLVDAFRSSVSLEDPTVSDWYMDSDATHHMTASSSSLDSIVPYHASGNQGGGGSRTM